MALNRITMPRMMPDFKMETRSPLTQSLGGSVSFVPNQRLQNHQMTARQVMNYSMSKDLLYQGSTDMRGNIEGYSDTLG
jgi:hypothetical protein